MFHHQGVVEMSTSCDGTIYEPKARKLELWRACVLMRKCKLSVPFVFPSAICHIAGQEFFCTADDFGSSV